MSDLSKGQKLRLGIFLIAAISLAALVIVVKLGSVLFAKSDTYFVRVTDGVGGLVPGADVTYNGIVVGKVSAVMVDPVDVSMVRLELELQGKTPVPENTTAMVVLTGITGTRRVDLKGGTNGVRLRKPGEEIPYEPGIFDELLSKVERLSERLDGLGDKMNRLASDKNIASIEGTLANLERATDSVAGIVEDTRPRVAALMVSAETTSSEVALTLTAARKTLNKLDGAIDSTARIVTREVGPLVSDARAAIKRVDGLVGSAERVVGKADVAVGRTAGDVGRVLAKLAEGIESITDLADLLNRDPSSLINGKSWVGR